MDDRQIRFAASISVQTSNVTFWPGSVSIEDYVEKPALLFISVKARKMMGMFKHYDP